MNDPWEISEYLLIRKRLRATLRHLGGDYWACEVVAARKFCIAEVGIEKERVVVLDTAMIHGLDEAKAWALTTVKEIGKAP